MSVDYTLEIPAPCDWINSNQRLHRMEEARRTREWRQATFVAAKFMGVLDSSPTRFTVPVHITATIHKTRGGRWDAGNLYPTAKACVDGIVQAGILTDDSNEYVVGPDMRAGAKRDTASVVITIKALS